MKTTAFILTAVACFYIGYSFCLHINNVECRKKANAFNFELIKAQAAELDYAGKLISKHNIYDVDDSELMDKYIRSCGVVDSLYSIGM